MNKKDSNSLYWLYIAYLNSNKRTIKILQLYQYVVIENLHIYKENGYMTLRKD